MSSTESMNRNHYETDLTPDEWEEVRDMLVAQFDEPRHATRDELLDVIEDIAPDEVAGTFGYSHVVDDGVEAGVLVAHSVSEYTDEYSFDLTALPDEPAEMAGDEDADDESDEDDTDDLDTSDADGLGAFQAAIEFYHDCLDTDISDLEHTYVGDDGEQHVVQTPREFYREVRGWSDSLIDEYKLGWAPRRSDKAYDHALLSVYDEGYEKVDLQASGLFWEDSMNPVWTGRLVMPYLDESGEPVFAISRDAGHEYDSRHKYDKIRKREWIHVTEPIFGRNTVEDGEPLLITEGIADALSLHDHGYAAISPVTTSFKSSDHDRLLDLFEEHDTTRVFIIQDAERPLANGIEQSEEVVTHTQTGDEVTVYDVDDISLDQMGRGLAGALRTAKMLTSEDIDARIAEPPLCGLEKVDIDDFLREGFGTIEALCAMAVEPTRHPAYDTLNVSETVERDERSAEEKEHLQSDSTTALYSLEPSDVLPELKGGYRGHNPFEPIGDSDNYFQYDPNNTDFGDRPTCHKHDVTYTPMSLLLCKAELRSPSMPNGSVSNEETFKAWKFAKEDGIIPRADPIPRAAMAYIAQKHGIRPDATEDTKFRDGEYRAIIKTVEDTYGLDAGREYSDEEFVWHETFDDEDLSLFLTHPAGVVAGYADVELDDIQFSENGRYWSPDGVQWKDAFSLVAYLEGVVPKYVDVGWMHEVEDDELINVATTAVTEYDFRGEPPSRVITAVANVFFDEQPDEDGRLDAIVRSDAKETFKRLCESQ